MRFHPDRPHAQVFGVPGVQWQQHGAYFRLDGSLVEGDPDRDREIREIKAVLADPRADPELRIAMRDRLAEIDRPEPVSEPEDDDDTPSDDMRLASNKALKAQLAIYGEEWKGVAHARKFLEGRD